MELNKIVFGKKKNDSEMIDDWRNRKSEGNINRMKDKMNICSLIAYNIDESNDPKLVGALRLRSQGL